MKRFLTHIVAGATLLTFAGCSSLDMEPTSSIADNKYWKDAAQVDAFNQGLHGLLRERSYNLFLLGEPRADYYTGELSFTGSGAPELTYLWNNTIRRTAPLVSNYGGFYIVINQLNLMIKKMQEVEAVKEATRQYYLGEAYGMRAFVYFQILRSWGDAIIWTDYSDGNSLDPGNLAKAASSETDVMGQIINDIADSEKAFADNASFLNGKRYYWSKAATLMLKGEVYLWKGRRMNGGDADYRIAKSALESVKGMGFELQSFTDVFSYDKKNNKEIIFNIYNGKDEYNLWGGVTYVENMLPLQATLHQNYVDENGVGFGELPIGDLVGINRYPVNSEFYVKGFHDQDTRKRGTLQAVYKKEAPSNVAGCYVTKFRGVKLPGSATRSMLDDYPIYRYADCLLLLATVKASLNEDITAEINAVRERAYGKTVFDSNKSTLGYPNDNDPALYTNNKFMKADSEGPIETILKERMREFMVEGKRWYDLRLMGYEYVQRYTTGVNSEDQLYWPIDINTTTNNPLLVDKHYK